MSNPLPKIAYYPTAHWERIESCRHWVLLEEDQIPDGCPRCRGLEMRDEHDRYKNRREP